MQANKLPSLLDAPLSAGTRVLLALDLNVSCQDGKVTDTFRIEKVLPTLEYLSKKGCRTMIISHMGSDGSRTLAPIAEFLRKTFDRIKTNTPLFVCARRCEIRDQITTLDEIFESI